MRLVDRIAVEFYVLRVVCVVVFFGWCGCMFLGFIYFFVVLRLLFSVLFLGCMLGLYVG